MGFFSVLAKRWSFRRGKRFRRADAFSQQPSTPALSPRRLEQRRVLDGAAAGLVLAPLGGAGEFVQVGPLDTEGNSSEPLSAAPIANDAPTAPSLISGGTSSFNNFSYSTAPPTVLSVTPSDSLLSDADAGSGSFSLDVQFDAPMIADGSFDPTLTFSPTVDSSLTLSSGSWSSDAMTYTATYDVADTNVTALDIDVLVEGGRNIDGILQEPGTTLDVFGVDTQNPSVVGMTPSTSLVTDADVGAGNFSIDLTYSEAMTIDGSADPTIVFTPSVANTLTFSNGVWLNSTTYRATYDVADANESLQDVAASVSGGRDAEGNPQIARLDTRFFSIDTESFSGGLAIESLTVTPSVNENGVADLQLQISNPNSDGAHTVEIDWGDGSALETFTLPSEITALVTTHQYLDDNPTGTLSDTYTVQVRVIDEEEGSVEETAEVVVNNLAPLNLQIIPLAAVDENGLALLQLTFDELGPQDTHTVEVNWGDGTASETFLLDPGARSFATTHQYLDDNPSGTSSDVNTVSVRVLDDDGGVVVGNTSIVVNNVAPMNLQIQPLAAIDENGTAQLELSFDDPGTQDTHSVEVNWGDGTALETFNLDPGTRSLSAMHQYLDDNPTGTAQDVYTVQVRVLDDDGGELLGNAPLTVSNVAPAIVSVLQDQEIKSEGDTFNLSVEFTDPGTLDTHTYEVDWGDGILTNGAITGRNFLASHVYADDGTYSVEVRVLDDDTGIGTTTFQTVVENAAPSLSFVGEQTISEGESFNLANIGVGLSDPGFDNALNVLDPDNGGEVVETFVGVSIDWGDGTPLETDVQIVNRVSGSPGVATTASFSHPDHVYADNGTYTVAVRFLDDDTDLDDGPVVETFTLVVDNVAPTLTLTDETLVVDEGSLLNIPTLGVFTDPGFNNPLNVADASNGGEVVESFTYTIDWDDGTVETGQLPVSVSSGGPGVPTMGQIANSHIYGDNGTFVVKVVLSDDDAGASAEQTITVVVNNVAPLNLQIEPLDAIDENGFGQLQLTFDDPGTLDTHTVEVDWGDNSGLETFTLDPGARSLSTSHQYLDDNPTATPQDDYLVQVRVLDDDGGDVSGTGTITVNNVAPLNLQIEPLDAIDENGFGQLQLTFDDPGSLDTHTVEVDWGDNSGLETFTLDPGARSLSTSHRYLDDNPTATPQDDYLVQVRVLDDDGGDVSGTGTITVNNVAPSNIQFVAVESINENDFAQLQFTFEDPGTQDTHVVTIDWADGTVESFSLDPGARSFSTTHQYLDDNPTGTSEDEIFIGVTITDDDTLSGSDSTPVIVRNVAPSNLVLDVTPSPGNAPGPSDPTDPPAPTGPPAPSSLGGGPVLTSTGTSEPIELDLLEGLDDPEQELIAALLASGSGISVVSGSERFVGRLGDGVDPNLAQSATYSNFTLIPSDGSRPSILLNGGGIFLTSGVANIPFTNTSTSFGSGDVGVSAPDEGVSGDTDDLVNILSSAGQSTSVNNVNLIEFEFTVVPGTTSIEAEFVFASDEFPDQGVTDIFAFIVDGTNFALFPDGSLVSFVEGQNAANFNDNADSAYEIEYDGISNVLRVVGILDDSIPDGGTHTLKIAIANTSDTIFDSGVFVGQLQAGTAEDGGIEQPPANDSITGFKFEDLDGDGVRGVGEPGLAGVTIFIDANDNGVLDDGELSTVTQQDNPATAADETGRFSFAGLEDGTFIVREVVSAGFVPTSPVISTIVDPAGVNNPTSGDVSPSLIDLTLTDGEPASETVSLTLPTSGGAVNMVDIFLLFDDTGSFEATVSAVSAVLQSGIAELQAALPDISFGFGGGRFEEFGGSFTSVSGDNSTARPFILNQPIITTETVGFADALNAALERDAPGGGGDLPETLLEALFQIATGVGFDGDGNGSSLDSGPAGLASTQTLPGNSGDVPPFSSFVPDPANNVLPPAGTVGGVGFRPGALPIIIVASDVGTVFRSESVDPIVGAGGITVPLSAFLPGSRQSTPDSDGDGMEDGASIQQTITALNDLGALVLGLGTNDDPADDPRIVMEAIATLTGAVNGSSGSIDSNIPTDPIDPGDPLYFLIDESVSSNVVDGIVAAVQSAITNVSFDVEVRASDPSVSFVNTTGILTGVGEGDTATFDVQFTGDDMARRFDLQFVRAGTDVQLGSIPVEISTVVLTPGSRVVTIDSGASVSGVNFGNQRIPTTGNVVIFENDSVDLDISFSDIGMLDTHTIFIDWGDGVIDEIRTGDPNFTILSPGQFSAEMSHTYLDDNPTDTPQDPYTIIVTVIDDDTGEVLSTSDVLVVNVAPRLTPELAPGETPPDETEPAPLASTPVDDGITVITGSFGDRSVADSESFTIVVDWGDGSALESFPFDNQENPQNFLLTHDYNPFSLPPEQLPLLNSASEILVSLTLMDDDLGVDTETVIVINPVNPDQGVSIDTTPQVPSLAFQRPPDMGLFLDNSSKGDESLQGIDVRSSGGETKAVSDRYLVIYDIDPEGRVGEEHKLEFDVLDDLPALFRKLPDNHYKIDQIHEETNSRRPVLDVFVREGALIDPSDDTEGTRDRPPMDATSEDLEDELEKKNPSDPPAIELEKPADELSPAVPGDDPTSMHSISRELAMSLHRGRDHRSLALAPIAAGLVATSSFASWAQQVDRTVAAAGSRKWHRLRWRRFPVRKDQQ